MDDEKSKAGRAMVNIRWAKSSKEDIKKQIDLMNKARLKKLKKKNG